MNKLTILLLASLLVSCMDHTPPPIEERRTVIQFSATGDTLFICTEAHHFWIRENGITFDCGNTESIFISGTYQIK